MSFVAEAIKLAVQHHHGQKYYDNTYMDGHIYPVVLQAELIARGAKLSSTEVECVQAIAYMHDLLKMTTVDLAMIHDVGRCPEAVPNAVNALTKQENEAQGTYLQRIVTCNIYATIVKLADSMVNLRTALCVGASRKVLEYSNNINFLSTVVSREIERRQHAL